MFEIAGGIILAILFFVFLSYLIRAGLFVIGAVLSVAAIGFIILLVKGLVDGNPSATNALIIILCIVLMFGYLLGFHLLSEAGQNIKVCFSIKKPWIRFEKMQKAASQAKK